MKIEVMDCDENGFPEPATEGKEFGSRGFPTKYPFKELKNCEGRICRKDDEGQVMEDGEEVSGIVANTAQTSNTLFTTFESTSTPHIQFIR
jgi:hypothetical protein